jgi:hypothetical protein
VRELARKLGLRGVLVVGLAVAVLVVVAIARLVGNSDQTQAYLPDVTVTSTVDPTSGDDGEVPSPTAFPDDLAVQSAADAFGKAWLQQDRNANSWLEALRPMITDSLAANLVGVDPHSVPASRVVTGAVIDIRTEDFARTRSAVDTGTLVLGLNKSNDHWLVDSVDWERS